MVGVFPSCNKLNKLAFKVTPMDRFERAINRAMLFGKSNDTLTDVTFEGLEHQIKVPSLPVLLKLSHQAFSVVRRWQRQRIQRTALRGLRPVESESQRPDGRLQSHYFELVTQDSVHDAADFIFSAFGEAGPLSYNLTRRHYYKILLGRDPMTLQFMRVPLDCPFHQGETHWCRIGLTSMISVSDACFDAYLRGSIDQFNPKQLQRPQASDRRVNLIAQMLMPSVHIALYPKRRHRIIREAVSHHMATYLKARGISGSEFQTAHLNLVAEKYTTFGGHKLSFGGFWPVVDKRGDAMLSPRKMEIWAQIGSQIDCQSDQVKKNAAGLRAAIQRYL